MAYKISGTLNESARILVLKESDWSIEANVEKSVGDYEIENLVDGTKTVVAIDNSGEVVGYGSVEPSFYDNSRGVFGGGTNAYSLIKNIKYITIPILGNVNQFGTLSDFRYEAAATSNGTDDRGVFGGGYHSDRLNIIEYITISVLGNAHNFGRLTSRRQTLAAASNNRNNRGVFGGGDGVNIIDYITISTTGNATDFGDLSDDVMELAATSNGVNDRAVFGGGMDPHNEYHTMSKIDYITISTTGNAMDFGNLSPRGKLAATSNDINNRGIFGGGYWRTSGGGGSVDYIQYITISSLSNAHAFGDLPNATKELSSTSNGISNRGIFSGGRISTGLISEISYVTISTRSNATHFGNLNIATSWQAATSNA